MGNSKLVNDMMAQVKEAAGMNRSFLVLEASALEMMNRMGLTDDQIIQIREMLKQNYGYSASYQVIYDMVGSFLRTNKKSDDPMVDAVNRSLAGKKVS